MVIQMVNYDLGFEEFFTDIINCDMTREVYKGGCGKYKSFNIISQVIS